MIYLDNSATTITKPPQVAQAVYEAIKSQSFGNASRGVYDPSHHALQELFFCRQKVAELFAVDDPLSIAFTPGITWGLNLVLQGLFSSGDHIITGVAEHNSVLRPLYQLEEKGVELSFVKLNHHYEYDLSSLEDLYQENTKAVVLTQVSNVTGAITDPKKLYQFCKKKNLLLILDGAQGGGSIETRLEGDLPELIYCFTGHKSLYGPMGTGGVINLSNRSFHHIITGGSGVRSFDRKNPDNFPDVLEPGTVNIHSLMGLKAGVEELLEREMIYVQRYLNFHRNKLYDGLQNIKGIKIFSPESGGPILSFSMAGKNSQEVAETLYRDFKICCRGGIHCAPLLHRELNTADQGLVRLSLSMYNRVEEIDHALFALQKLSKYK